jgi:hypothetical protein
LPRRAKPQRGGGGNKWSGAADWVTLPPACTACALHARTHARLRAAAVRTAARCGVRMCVIVQAPGLIFL